MARVIYPGCAREVRPGLVCGPNLSSEYPPILVRGSQGSNHGRWQGGEGTDRRRLKVEAMEIGQGGASIQLLRREKGAKREEDSSR